MFDQSFVSSKTVGRKPATFSLSLGIQSAAVALLILFSIGTAQHLPPAQVRSLLTLPKAPVVVQTSGTAATPNPMGAQRTAALSFVPPAPAFAHPSAPPFRSEIAAAPDLGVPSGTPDPNGGVIADAVTGSVSVQPILPPETKQHSQPNAGPLRLSAGVAAANVIRKVMPEYPALARSAGVQGTVKFRAVINESGEIVNLQLVSGHPLLVGAARNALLQWRFRPTTLNGITVSVATEITVNFNLGSTAP